jgi:hypothetical protein
MSIVKDFLKQKDGDYSQYVPASYNLSQGDKQKSILFTTLKATYQLETAGKCISPCFKNFESPVVSERESECMTNCVAKGLEIFSILQVMSGR